MSHAETSVSACGLSPESDCKTCQGEVPLLGDADIAKRLIELGTPWEVRRENGVPRLFRTFNFLDYSTAQLFRQAIAALCEKLGYHADDKIRSWNNVDVEICTHNPSSSGLHEVSFKLADMIDGIIGSAAPGVNDGLRVWFVPTK